MKINRFATQFQCSMMALVLMSVCPAGALAQDGHSHETTTQRQQLTAAQSALLKIVRDNTERFKDVSVAEREGYSLLFGCVSGPDAGAMGMHYVNLPLVAAGVIDATRPQIVIYEPMPDGHLQLIGADFLVIASDWDKAHPGQGAPQLMGQLSLFREPQSLRTPSVLHASCVGMEREPQRRLRELAPQRFMPGFCRPIA
jgi:hypothetical protein